jgi:hypothetical protein
MRIGIGIRIGNSITGSVLDPATSAFITAFGITDPTQINALNRLVLNYKGQGNLNSSVDLWTDSSAIYPIVGGSASQHTGNLKDPRNLDAAFRLAFSGGWTHSGNGMLPNGVNAFANTFIIPNTLPQNDVALGIYSRTNNTTASTVDAGVNVSSIDFVNIIRWDGTLGNLSRLNNGFVSGGYVPSKTNGDFIVSRSASNSTKVFEDGVLKQTKTDASGTRPNVAIYLGARNSSGTAAFFSDRQLAFGEVRSSLSDSNALLRYQIIQQFQTDLGRNI